MLLNGRSVNVKSRNKDANVKRRGPTHDTVNTVSIRHAIFIGEVLEFSSVDGLGLEERNVLPVISVNWK